MALWQCPPPVPFRMCSVRFADRLLLHCKLPHGCWESFTFANHQTLSCLRFLSQACGNKVDPVYEALRFGTSLAQKAKRPSGSESPNRNSVRESGVVYFPVFACVLKFPYWVPFTLPAISDCEACRENSTEKRDL